MNEVKIEFVKLGEGAGRPSKMAVLADGSKIPYKEWYKSQPKGKRGRKPLPRDAEGKVIRQEKVEAPVETPAETPETAVEVPAQA